jgi:acyl dehydratase
VVGRDQPQRVAGTRLIGQTGFDAGDVAAVSGKYLDDFSVGEVIESAEEYEMTPERIAAFASDYDPQPIHLDAAAAAQSIFGGIIASGWHSLSATMRLMVRSNIFDGAPVVGVGVDHLRYLKPVRGGDRLRARAEVLETRPSSSTPERGYLVLRVVTSRGNGEEVLTQEWTVLVPSRLDSER